MTTATDVVPGERHMRRPGRAGYTFTWLGWPADGQAGQRQNRHVPLYRSGVPQARTADAATGFLVIVPDRARAPLSRAAARRGWHREQP